MGSFMISLGQGSCYLGLKEKNSMSYCQKRIIKDEDLTQIMMHITKEQKS